MKNIQVIDGADNCRYPIYSATEQEFLVVFPADRQDVEFIEDAIARVGKKKLGVVLGKIWQREVAKPQVSGIHGTLFYELAGKKKYYPTKKEVEMVLAL